MLERVSNKVSKIVLTKLYHFCNNWIDIEVNFKITAYSLEEEFKLIADS